MIDKTEFLMRHKHLWVHRTFDIIYDSYKNNPDMRALVDKAKEEGLYSNKTVNGDVGLSLGKAIRKIRDEQRLKMEGKDE